MNDENARPWIPAGLDANGDGQVTITDLWDGLVQLLLMPGDGVLALLLTHAPGVAEFFELSPTDYGSPLSKFISAGAWFILLILAVMIWSAIRNVDRFLTAYVSGRYAELTRQLRILRRRVTSWIGLLRHRRRSRSPSLTVGNVELGQLESAVLRCYADVGDFRVITARDVAASLELSLRQVQPVLRRLSEFRLVERSFGTDEGQDGHHITQAGQIYLIDH